MDASISVISTANLAFDSATASKIEVPAQVVQHVLGVQPDWAARSVAWNPQILERLAKLDSRVREAFSERGSLLPKLKLRMINPQPPQLPEELRYDALTYTWHKDSWNIAEELQVAGKESMVDGNREPRAQDPVSPGLWKVLLSESASAGNLLWVDQVCINQEDRDEKVVSVGFTDRVYQNSERTFIAIEDLSIPESIIPSLQVLSQMEAVTKQNFASLNATVVQDAVSFCTTVFSARLFSRSWCWHEFACADRHLLFIPIAQQNASSDLKILRMDSQSLRNIIYSMGMLIKTASDEQMQAIIPYQSSIGMALRAGTKILKRQINPSFVEAYRNAFRSMAKHKSDQVTIILNSCASGLLYTGPPLDSNEECYRLIHSVALAAGDASVIGVTGTTLNARSGSSSSWLMEPGDDEARAGFHIMRSEPTFFDVYINERGGLCINMILLGSVGEVRSLETRYVDIASAFMDLDFENISNREPFIFETRLHNMVLDASQKEELRFRFVNQKFFYAQALAYLLAQTGVSFLDVFEDPAMPSSKLLLVGERKCLEEVLNWLREYTGPPHASHLQHSRPQAITNDNVSVLTELLVNFVNKILGVKDMYNTENLKSWYSFKIGILSSTMLSKTNIPIVVPRSNPDALIGVPADVAGPDYSLLRRVWILQKISNIQAIGMAEETARFEEKYSLHSKTMLVGLQDLTNSPYSKLEIV